MRVKNYQPTRIRKLAAKLIAEANAKQWSHLCIDVTTFNLMADEQQQAFIEGLLLSTYRFNVYKTAKEKIKHVAEICLIGPVNSSCLAKTKAIVNGVAHARDCGNHPPNVMTPNYLATQARNLSKKRHTSVTVIDESEFEALGMGGLYGVARGSKQAAKLIVCHYQHPDAKEKKPFAIVGKGVTFDSGGISIKPSAKMDEMKYDMCGGAAALGTMLAITENQPPWHVVMAIAATENMPGGNAQKPGDIVTAYNGKTIEVLNTDAEGRLILADALSYMTKEYQPRAMVNLATLTGAVIVALGHYATGLMGNDKKLIEAIKEASLATHERVWELPLWDEYCKDIESNIADLKNLGKGGAAGSITAGAFLKAFVGNTPWCHLDIAGTAWGDTSLPYESTTLATGVGVRLLYQLLEQMHA